VWGEAFLLERFQLTVKIHLSWFFLPDELTLLSVPCRRGCVPAGEGCVPRLLVSGFGRSWAELPSNWTFKTSLPGRQEAPGQIKGKESQQRRATVQRPPFCPAAGMTPRWSLPLQADEELRVQSLWVWVVGRDCLFPPLEPWRASRSRGGRLNGKTGQVSIRGRYCWVEAGDGVF